MVTQLKNNNDGNDIILASSIKDIKCFLLTTTIEMTPSLLILIIGIID